MSLLARLFPWVSCLILGLIVWGLQSQLSAERDFRSSVQAQLHAPNNKPATLSAYLTGQANELLNYSAALQSSAKQAADDKARSDAADARLDEAQQTNQRMLAALQGELTILKNRKSTGNADADCKTIEQDSELPWKGWHQ